MEKVCKEPGNMLKFFLWKDHLPVASGMVNRMKKIDTGEVEFPRNSQKVCKIVRLASKAQDIVHDHKLVEYIFSPIKILSL